jgi:hypothetical protein
MASRDGPIWADCLVSRPRFRYSALERVLSAQQGDIVSAGRTHQIWRSPVLPEPSPSKSLYASFDDKSTELDVKHAHTEKVRVLP